jgi:hypothetical protein
LVTDGIASAVAKAKNAAGGKSVYVIGGASIEPAAPGRWIGRRAADAITLS